MNATKEELLSIFVAGAAQYFDDVTAEKADVGAPYLLGSHELGVVMLAYSAVIGITGNLRGSIIYTAEPGLVEALARKIGEANPDPALCADMVGEVTNTISGNARRDLGSDFLISVPVMISSKPDQMHLPRGVDIFVIPVTWRGFASYLVVGLEGAR